MAMDMNQMMRQARKMQAEMEKVQQEIAEQQFTASAGGGAVEATVDGTMHLVSVKISPDALDPEDVEILQDMVVAAVNEALSDVENTTNERMSAVTGGMNIPGMKF